jgi:hypothetical protein
LVLTTRAIRGGKKERDKLGRKEGANKKEKEVKLKLNRKETMKEKYI